MNWVFATQSNFRIPIVLEPDGANLLYFKLRFLIYTLGYKDIDIRKPEFVEKTQWFVYREVNSILFERIWNWKNFSTNSDFLIPISLQPYGVDLCYF